MTAALSELLTWLTGGSAMAALAKVLIAVSALVLGLICRRYVGILGADRRRPAERQAYDALRNGLSRGNIAARLYAERLSGLLAWIDRFFGDDGEADLTLFPHAFGLKTPAPLWTGPSLDRCLFLAFIYPVASVFVIWAVSGEVGPAETALHLKPGLSGWQTSLAAAAVALCIFAAGRSSRRNSLLREDVLALVLLGVVAGGISVIIAAAIYIGSLAAAYGRLSATSGSVAVGQALGGVLGGVGGSIITEFAAGSAVALGTAIVLGVAVLIGVALVKIIVLHAPMNRSAVFGFLLYPVFSGVVIGAVSGAVSGTGADEGAVMGIFVCGGR